MTERIRSLGLESFLNHLERKIAQLEGYRLYVAALSLAYHVIKPYQFALVKGKLCVVRSL